MTNLQISGHTCWVENIVPCVVAHIIMTNGIHVQYKQKESENIPYRIVYKSQYYLKLSLYFISIKQQ